MVLNSEKISGTKQSLTIEESSIIEWQSNISEKNTKETFTTRKGLILRISFFIYLLLIIMVASLMILIIWNFPKVISYFPKQRTTMYLFSFFSGMCGGAMYALIGFYRRHADKTLDLFSWWPWYLGRPWISGFFTSTIIALLNTGIMILQFKITTNGAVVGLSFLIGFGFHQVLKKLEDTIETLFASKRLTKTPDQDSQSKIQENQQRPYEM